MSAGSPPGSVSTGVIHTGNYTSEEVSAEFFGANFLLGRDDLNGTFDEKISQLGVTLLRYPGGEIAEKRFDITNPDDEPANFSGTFTSLSEFLVYCAAQGITPTIVIPTKKYADDVSQGVADVTEFVQRLTSGEFGEVDGLILEVGNEYYVGSNTGMYDALSADAYGDLASKFATAIKDVDPTGIKVGVQSGKTDADNDAIISHFDLQSEKSAVDLIAFHDYPWNFSSMETRIQTKMQRVDDWADNGVSAEVYLSEWNIGSNSNAATDAAHDYGLAQASALIEHASEAIKAGIGYGASWAVQQNNKTSLTGNEGDSEIRFAGHTFRMLQESITGAKAVDASGDTDEYKLHAFESDAMIVVFVSARDIADDTTPLNVQVDLSGIGAAVNYVWAEELTTFGSPTDYKAAADVSTYVPELLQTGGNFSALVTLDTDYEVVRLIFAKTNPGSDTVFLSGDGRDDNFSGGGGDDRLLGNMGDDVLQGLAGSDILDGGSGRDTADYAGSASGVRISLAAGTGVGGHAEGDVLVSIEDVVGSDYQDTLIGDSQDNTLSGMDGDDFLFDLQGGDDTLAGGDGDDQMQGGSGADQYFGGQGADSVRYVLSDAAVQVDLAANTASGGHAGGDVFDSVENLTGSQYGDTLAGNAAANVLEGFDGDDVLSGGGGADHLNGGSGTDTASYSDSATGVDIGLHRVGTGGTAEGDTFFDIEAIIGSDFDDTLVAGGNGLPILFGGGGDDFLFDYGADAELYGGAGDDVFVGGTGSDLFDGGAGTDTVRYANAIGSVTANLETGTGLGADAEGDQFAGIESLVGSIFDDVLTGNAQDNRLDGGRGRDTLTGGDGTDHLIGGADADTFVFSSTSWGSDYIYDFEVGIDTLDFSGLGLTGSEVSLVSTAAGARLDVLTADGTQTVSLLSMDVFDFDFADILL